MRKLSDNEMRKEKNRLMWEKRVARWNKWKLEQLAKKAIDKQN